MKCITLNGALYRVKEGFDETEGSEDMRALIELDAVLRRGIERHVCADTTSRRSTRSLASFIGCSARRCAAGAATTVDH